MKTVEPKQIAHNVMVLHHRICLCQSAAAWQNESFSVHDPFPSSSNFLLGFLNSFKKSMVSVDRN
jgi:hypothetical protein